MITRRSLLLFGQDNRPTPAFADFMRDVQVPGETFQEIDDALQARFFQKNPDGTPRERWELEKVEAGCPQEIFRMHLNACGFGGATLPTEKEYAYTAWPGALVARAAPRLNDLSQVWQDRVRWRETVAFGGKRALQVDKENYEACCKAINVEPDVGHYGDMSDEALREVISFHRYLWEKMQPQTELDMMRWVWENAAFPRSLRSTPVTFVDAPLKPPAKEGGQPVRPNTEDTITEWLKSNPKPGSMLVSCGAPYGMAIGEAFGMLLEPHGFRIEVFGHAAPDFSVERFMREVAGAVHRIRRNRLG